jgi:pimeloyl-ACP methyl ester carboxylesterase
MPVKMIDKFWHRTLKRPYHLARVVDEGEGSAIILLHGLGRSSQGWKYLIAGLQHRGVRVVAFDLLGFGASPKPDWPDYNVDDHAKAVIASIKKLKLNEPAIVVGHSMGCLVAIRAARLRPDLVRHLVLYEMPLYEGLPQKRRYRLRTNIYFRLYQRIASIQPITEAAAPAIQRLTRRIAGFDMTEESWLPFTRSLQNTIMKQTAAEDIKHLLMPMDVIYGKFDMLVIRGQPRDFFGDDSEHITAHTIKVRHMISRSASGFILERIEAALGGRGARSSPDRDVIG